MNALDIVVAVAASVFAVSGYRQGLLVGAATLLGFAGGAAAGMWLSPLVLAGWEPGVAQSLAALGIVVGLAALLQLFARVGAQALRGRLSWRRARLVDSGLGAVASLVALLLVTYVVAAAVRHGPSPVVAQQVRESRLLNAVDEVVPWGAESMFASFRALLHGDGFPQIFSGLAPERILPVDPPSQRVAESPALTRLRARMVKVAGSAGECGRHVEGSGFVFAPERVMTNAHVVAGVANPRVRVGGEGRSWAATTVLFDPELDIAVLAVPDLPAPVLRFAEGAERGDEGVAVGFPRGGPFTVVPARVRERLDVRGPDIYGEREITRTVLSLYTRVSKGNSGGPLVTPGGRVSGVIFAKSVDDSRTGYALPTEEVLPLAHAGRDAEEPVDTGPCALR